MNPELQSRLMRALERPHRLGMIGGDLEEQLAHCASFSSVLAQLFAEAPPKRAVDLGTGGGLPGVALAAIWQETEWRLLDARAGRVAEVDRVLARLGLAPRAQTSIGVAQQVGHDPDWRASFDVVVARAFGPPSLTAECAAGLLRPGGVLIVSEPPESEPGRWDPMGIAALGFTEIQHVTGAGRPFVVLSKGHETPPSIPRLPAKPKRGWFRP